MRELRFEISTLCMYECKICPHKKEWEKRLKKLLKDNT